MTSYVNLVSLNPSRTYYKGDVALTADSPDAAKKIASMKEAKAQIKGVSGSRVSLTVAGVGLTLQFEKSADLKRVMPGDHVTIKHSGLTVKEGKTLSGGSFDITF